MKDEWLFPNAVVPVDTQTTLALLVEIKRLIDVQNMASESTYKAALAQQETVVGTKTWFEDGKVVTQYLTAKDIYKEPAQERNFCPRCGKRTADLTVIHTCTPPQENT